MKLFYTSLLRLAIPSLSIKAAVRMLVLLVLSMGALLLGGIPLAQAQAPTWQNLLTTAQPDANNAYGITASALDGNGNDYLTGYFSGTIKLGATTLSSLGTTDVFVAKRNLATGSFGWAVQAGGTSIDRATSLVVSGSSLYVAGFFASSTAGFGTTTLTNAGVTDIFAAKLADTGTGASFTWAQRAGGSSDDRAYALAVSGTRVYIGGLFYSFNADFGPVTLLMQVPGLRLMRLWPSSPMPGLQATLPGPGKAGATASTR